MVAPLDFLSDNVQRKHILEHEAREVPRCHHIGEHRHVLLVAAAYLSRRGGFVVAVEGRVVFVVALSDDEHYLRRAKRAAVYPYVVLCLYERAHLLRSQMVREKAERQPVERLIEVGAVGSGEFMLHLAYVAAREHLPHLGLVACRGYACPHHHACRCQACCCLKIAHYAAAQDRYALAQGRKALRQLCRYPPNSVNRHHQHHPSHCCLQQVSSHIAREELASLALVGLESQQQHRGIER